MAAERVTLDELLTRAEAGITRYEPAAAQAAREAGAQIVDVRTHRDRASDGIVSGSIHVPRTLLEWRLSPDSGWSNPHFGDFDVPVIVICDGGYSSRLAAAVLGELGYKSTGDVIGGFKGWKAAGLPVSPAPEPPDGLDGMSGPDD